jgi:ankyrin repeat protein
MTVFAFAHHMSSRFRWIFCQLETLRGAVHRNLRGILAKLPKTLDETYERILKGINENNIEHARRLLHCLVVAIRPLRVEELAEILAFDFDDLEGGLPKFRTDWRLKDQEEAVLSTCSSLISVVDSRDMDVYPSRKCRVVQFSHFSVKEFLTSDRLASSAGDVSRYHILPGPAHTILAQACLGFILHLDTPTNEETSKRLPLARYAAEHWVTHAQFEDITSHVKDGMQSLFDPDKHHLAAWVGIHDIDHNHRGTSNPLYYAAFCGFHDLVEHLIISHPQLINAVGGYFHFPVVAALFRKHTRVAELLLRHGGKVDIRGENSTPLQILIESAFTHEEDLVVDSVSLLLQHGANVNFRGSDLSTPLHSATASTSLKVVQLLLESGADIHSRDDKGKTPLHMVLCFQDDEDETEAREITRLLLERGANVNAQDNDGATLLLLAAYEGYYEISRILLMHGAEPNAKNNDGETALHRSLAHPNPDIRNVAYDLVPILLEHGAKPNVANKEGKTPLHLTFELEPKGCGYYDVEDAEVFTARLVLLLLEHDANVNVQDKDKKIPLLLTIELMMYDITRVLLARGADPTVKNDGGKTPLHLLLEGDFSDEDDIPDLARLLLDRGADVNTQDKNHATPLLLAAEWHMDDIARILLERRADPNVKNIQGKTPLHLLLERNFNDSDDLNDVLVVERLLLERGADVNAQDEDKTTPLHLASDHHIPEIAQIILNRANAENERRTAQLPVNTSLEGKYNF